MIDVYVENYVSLVIPEGFEDQLYNTLSVFIFELNNVYNRECIRAAVYNLFVTLWPEYPLKSVTVEAVSDYAVAVKVFSVDDQHEDVRVDYSCDYYIDYTLDTHNDELWEAMALEEETHIATIDDILYSPV